MKTPTMRDISGRGDCLSNKNLEFMFMTALFSVVKN